MALQEAKESSEVENIVAPHDEWYKANLFAEARTTQPLKKNKTMHLRKSRHLPKSGDSDLMELFEQTEIYMLYKGYD